MKRTMTTVAGTLMFVATPALATAGTEATGTGMLAILFLGFGALIVAAQLLPGLVLFCTMLKGLFGKVGKKAAEEA